MKNKIIKRADLILIVGILLASSLFLLLKNGNNLNPVATVTISGSVVDTIKLSEVGKSEIKSYLDGEVQLLVSKNEISFHHSSCKSQTCVNTGVLQKNGDTAACLPNKVLVSVNTEGQKGGFQTF